MPCGRHRIGRMQRPLLPDRRSGQDHRGRSQPRPCRAQQAEAHRRPPSAVVAVVLPLLRRGRRGGERRSLLALPQRQSRRRDASLLGRPRPLRIRTPAHLDVLAQCSIATACSAASSASAMLVARAYGVELRERAAARARSRSSGRSSRPRWRPCSTSRSCAGPPPASCRSTDSAFRRHNMPRSDRGAPNMAAVLRERVEKLTCEFSIDENYFAWQAFGRSYSDDGTGPLPPYLRTRAFPHHPRPRRSGRGAATARSRNTSRAGRPDRSTATCCSTRRTG